MCAVATATESPGRIITSWRRFSTGVWRLPRGDIADAYSGDTFPKIRTFTHDGRLFTNGGGSYGTLGHAIADCYPLLLPEDYTGPKEREYSYEGTAARLGEKAVILGAKMIFESDEPTTAEWIPLLRAVYAHGGYFINGRAYREFLASPPLKATAAITRAIELELAEVGAQRIPNTQAAMEEFLAAGVHESAGLNQGEFAL